MKKFYTLLLICAAGTGYSQQGFGTSNPAPSSVIDMVASNKGALLPRVTLTSTTVAAPVPSPTNALTVFNTATTGDVTPGYYYWSSADSKWVRLLTSAPQDLRVVGGTNHVTQDAGVGGNGTSLGAGANNITIGGGTMSSIANGNSNIGIGSGTLTQFQSGDDNIALGRGSLFDLQNGNRNVVIGGNSGGYMNNANNNIIIGNGVSSLSKSVPTFTSLSNSLNIGNTIYGSRDFNHGFGSTAVGAFYYNSDTDNVFKETFNVGNGSIWIKDINSTDYTGNAATDKVVVADTNGVLKTVAAADIAPATNIYNSDGTLTDYRTLNIGGQSLNFVGSNQATQWADFGYFYQLGLDSSPYGNASMAFLAADKDSNGKNSRLDIQTYPESNALITANGDATALALETSTTTNSAPITFTTSAGGNALGTEKMRITGEGNVGINNNTPTENLHVSGNVRFDNLPLDGTANAIFTTPAGDASSTKDQAFSATRTVVADANGVLGSITGIPLTTEVDGVIGNEVTNATANSGLTRAGAGTSVSPYTLGLTSGTATGQLMTWNGTAWNPAAPAAEVDGIIGNEVANATTNGGLARAGAGTSVSPYTLGLTSGTSTGQLMTWNGTAWNPAAPAASTNIYNANGSLTGTRTLTNNGFDLTFFGTTQSTTFSPTLGLSQRGMGSDKRASIIIASDDDNSDGVNSSMQIFQDPESVGQINATADSRGLYIGTTNTTQPAPIVFTTSTGSEATGTEKMRITPTGNVGIGISSATEKLDNFGITRLRTLPLNGTTNAINTTSGGTASASQDQTFTATKTVVADANGVLGSITGIPLTTEVDAVIGNEVTDATTNGGLARAGAGTNASPYTLGLTSGTSTGQLMTWNGTAWNPAAPAASTNIYNANGSLTSTRTLTNNGFGLTFLGTNQSTTFSATGGISQRGMASGKRASIIIASDDNNSDGVNSNMQLFQDPESFSQINVVADSRGLYMGSTGTTQAAPIIFMTSTGSGATGTEKMRITPTGNVGINTTAPAAKLHVVKSAADLTPAIIEGCNTYTDNTAATTAGLPVGALYRKADGTLMVRF